MHLSVTFASLSIASLSFTVQCMSYLFKKFLSLCVYCLSLCDQCIFVSLSLPKSLSVCLLDASFIYCMSSSFFRFLSIYSVSLSNISLCFLSPSDYKRFIQRHNQQTWWWWWRCHSWRGCLKSRIYLSQFKTSSIYQQKKLLILLGIKPELDLMISVMMYP